MKSTGRLPSTGGIVARLGVLGLVAGGLGFVAAAPASADSFTLTQKPTISVEAPTTTAWTLSPPNDWATGQDGLLQQQIVANVTDDSGTNNISDVSFCFYNVGSVAQAESATALCNTTDDPQTHVTAHWTRADTDRTTQPVFGTSLDWGKWWDLTQHSTTYDASATSTQTTMSITVDMTISPVARAGQWKLQAFATHTSGAPDNNLTTSDDGGGAYDVSMDYFGGFSAPRDDLSWGAISPASTSEAKSGSAGTVITNAKSELTYSVNDFELATDNSKTIANGASGTTGVNQFRYTCNSGTVFNSASAATVGTTATPVATDVTDGGTTEDGTALTQVCAIQLGAVSSLPVGQYNAVVNAGLIPSP